MVARSHGVRPFSPRQTCESSFRTFERSNIKGVPGARSVDLQILR